MKRLSTPQIAFFVALVTLGSKFVGFAREVLQANYYGTTHVVDSLGLAEGIPVLVFSGLFAATATSFLPLFSERMESEGQTSANRFTSEVINILLVLCVISSAVGILFARQLVVLFTMPEIAAPETAGFFGKIGWFLTHGWTGEKAELSAFYVKVTFSYCLFNSVAGILESYIKYKGVFIRSSLSGVLMSIVMIFGLLASHIFGDPRIIVFGTFFGNGARLLMIAIIARRKGYTYIPDFRMNRTVRKMLAISIPVFLGTSMAQISALVDTILGSGLPTGNIASLHYSGLLISMIETISSFVIGMIVYPKISQAFAQRDEKRFAFLFSNGVVITLMIGIPITFATLVYNDEVVQIIYERGAFSSVSTELTSRALFFLAFGMSFAMVAGLASNAFISRHNARTPVKIYLLAILVNIVFDILLVGPMGNGGLTLATSLSNMTNALLLILLLRRRIPGLITKRTVQTIVRVTMAAVAAVAVSMPIYFGILHIFAAQGWRMPRTVLLGVDAIIAIVLYAVLLKKLRVRELSYFAEIPAMLRRGKNKEEPADV
jgi:putative peptidoglycan lipid II flippase